MSTSYIGQSVKRVEDKRFITGKGNYTDDITLVGMTFAAFVRSPYAHARVKKVDFHRGRCGYREWRALRLASKFQKWRYYERAQAPFAGGR
jgi:CO/xanthine dehydrogenase Mo-binding subunit